MVEPNEQDLERQGARPNVSPASESKELRQKRLILEEDERLDEVEEVDQLLADQQRMQCPDWERAQDADPVIKHMKSLMQEYGDVAPTKEQLLPELAEVKSLCQHWKLLEIVNGVVTRVMRDLTQQKIYARLVPAAMRIELFQRVHGYESGHFGYAKIYPLFSE